ncbi:MAG TPA: hypothetical protein VJU52_05180, partial [Flavobacterium sp.]|nr:hypothetical protein [Flavobacterium sp.]
FLLVWNIVEAIAKGILNFRLFPEGKMASYITQFFPLEAMSNLILEPFSRLSLIKSIGDQMGVENLKDYSVPFSAIVIVLCWTIIFLFLSYRILKNRDL